MSREVKTFGRVGGRESIRRQQQQQSKKERFSLSLAACKIGLRLTSVENVECVSSFRFVSWKEGKKKAANEKHSGVDSRSVGRSVGRQLEMKERRKKERDDVRSFVRFSSGSRRNFLKMASFFCVGARAERVTGLFDCLRATDGRTNGRTEGRASW